MFVRRNRRPGAASVRWLFALCTLCALGLGAAASADYVPYPGKIQVELVEVESAMSSVVRFETWPGFTREFRVTLPGIAVPSAAQRAPACERELAAKAVTFAREFLSDAEQISVSDMSMKTSADRDAVSPLLTDRGELTEALKEAKLARPDSVDRKKPWC